MADDTVPSGTFGDYAPSNSNAEEVKSQYQICQQSGFKVRVRDKTGRLTHELVKQWDGLYVDRRFKDERNPQDYIKAAGRDANHGNKRPEPDDGFVGTIEADDL